MNRNIRLAAKIKNACEYLQTGEELWNELWGACRYPDRYEYSCNAARETWNLHPHTEFDDEFYEFVDACGLDYYSASAFIEFEDVDELQYARAIWLTMLYHIRKDYEDGVIDL